MDENPCMTTLTGSSQNSPLQREAGERRREEKSEGESKGGREREGRRDWRGREERQQEQEGKSKRRRRGQAAPFIVSQAYLAVAR